MYYVQAVPGHRPMRAFPEEIIRQLVVLSLIHQYHYSEQRIRIEYPVQMGRTKKRADVVVLGESGVVEVVVEVKQRIDSDSVEQLKSYAMVTGASYGLAVSGLEYLCLKRENGNRFVEVEDIPVCGKDGDALIDGLQARGARFSPTATLRNSLQLEQFEKIDKSHVKLTIQGHPLNLPILDLASYKKVQKRFLSAGVVLTAEVKQPAWLSFIRELLAEAPNPVAPPSIDDQLSEKIGNWVRALPSERRFLTSGNVSQEALGGPSKKLSRRMSLRIANILRSLGWQTGHKRVNGVLFRGYWSGQRGEGKDNPRSIFGDLV